ncbi:hypothetical protein ACIOJE_21915 [Kitasatospora sp. NPDC087861]|uniref:hypothetical protein n=1 Tax=Kitasatospora sp. NPDC087861 TaxID=3364070 RepID=UPI00380EC597
MGLPKEKIQVLHLARHGSTLRSAERIRLQRWTPDYALWGGYCATIAQALRGHYGLPDQACAFFDFFAQPATALEQQAADALGPDPLDGPTLAAARAYGLLLQAHEHLFWDTLDRPN